MALWRCLNEQCTEDLFGRLGYDFESEEPICPKCTYDHRTYEGSEVVIKREVVHFIVIDRWGPIRTPKGRRRVACQPNNGIIGNQRLTSEPQVVNCPACKCSSIFPKDKANQTRSVVPSFNYSVEFDTTELLLKKVDPTDQGDNHGA